jgi:hypothetical protein
MFNHGGAQPRRADNPASALRDLANAQVLFFSSGLPMRSDDNDSNDILDDAQLLAKESMQRHEFLELEHTEPPFRDTTYGFLRGSRQLVESWDRWWSTNVAAQMRGLLTRPIGP